MIVRNRNQEAALCISQLHHSMMTGSIGLHWGNERIPKPPCFGLVQFAAAIHDIGWTEWELHPRIDENTGHPVDFLHMNNKEHVSIWDAAINKSSGYGAPVALLVFRHNLSLASKDTKPEKAAFLKQASYQESNLRKRAEGAWAYNLPLTAHLLKRMNTAILIWDYISLRMCMGSQAENPFGPPPIYEGIDFSMEPSADTPETFTVDPWPFKTDQFIWQTEAHTHQRNQPFNPNPATLTLIQTRLVPR